MAPTMELGGYLFARLRQLGIRDVIGVPGDFNLRLLDFVEPADLRWVGTCNELNAGYAADGYARVRGASAMVTTFGVGELSAANGIAGAFAERAPVVHIVGTPGQSVRAAPISMHHTFNDGNYRRFSVLAAQLTVAQTELTDAAKAPAEIDRVIEQCLLHSRPVYIELPTDMVDVPIDMSLLDKPLPHPADAKPDPALVQSVLDKLHAARSVVVLVDGEARSLRCAAELRALVEASGWPALFTTFGKGILDESRPNVLGLHTAAIADLPTQPLFDAADLVLEFGPHHSTTNTMAGKTIPAPDKTIAFTHDALLVHGKPASAGPFSAKAFLAALVAGLDATKLSKSDTSAVPHPSARPQPAKPAPESALSQDLFYAAVQPWVKEGDVIMGETGTPSWGSRSLRFSPGCQHFGATTWLSIGYMLPAALGAALGRRALALEAKGPAAASPATPNGSSDAGASATHNARVLLFMGDGSYQMTAQELSTIIRQRLPVTVFLINNGGYTIERCLHGWRAGYNDIAHWKYADMARSFGGDIATWKVATFGELDAVLSGSEFQAAEHGPRFVEVIMPQDDAPEMLYRVTSRPPKD